MKVPLSYGYNRNRDLNRAIHDPSDMQKRSNVLRVGLQSSYERSYSLSRVRPLYLLGLERQPCNGGFSCASPQPKSSVLAAVLLLLRKGSVLPMRGMDKPGDSLHWLDGVSASRRLERPAH
jgi:hypothetical protein